MIRVEHVSKSYPLANREHHVLKNISFTIHPGEKVGILGSNGAGKSTLIRVLSGAEKPTSGHIYRDMRLSWPLAFAGGFQGSLTGLDNLKFICRIYGVNYQEKKEFVREFTELGKHFHEPVRYYSAGMRARLAFALSMAVEFDCFLIDEVVAVGDARFHEKCRIELFEKRSDRALIMVSHNEGYVRKHCQHVWVLVDGSLHYFNTPDEAYLYYRQTMNAQ